MYTLATTIKNLHQWNLLKKIGPSSWKSCRAGYSTKLSWTSRDSRKTFLEFFKQRDHVIVPSSSVIPARNEGSYFVNAGMNQFKPIFLGTVDPSSTLASYRRVANSQKCICISGKHNDLEDVGRDYYHHTFFEMLGNWSFGDYFKEKACRLAWQLLTEVYGLPASRLYVTYFSGNDENGIPPDLACRDIWLQIGVPTNRIIGCGMKDNFWSMGETGPCGPCTEIHYDHTGGSDSAHLVNTGNDNVIELWNVVFMQFDRQADGTLRRLPQNHVDTGMGFERLTAVLQGTKSNYNTDLFTPLFNKIHKECGCPKYSGTLPDDVTSGSIDTAYRIVADHARMFSVAIADGLIPGRRESECKLRQVIYRCIHNATEVLQAKPGFVSSLVPVVAESLGSSYPELSKNIKKIEDVINETEERYLRSLHVGQKMLEKALKKYGATTSLSDNQLYEIQSGRFGSPVSADIICTLAERAGIAVDLEKFEEYMTHLNETSETDSSLNSVDTSKTLNQFLVEKLKNLSVNVTDDSFKYAYSFSSGKYNFSSLRARVVALLREGELVKKVEGEGGECLIVLDRTCFYSESGGQAGDRGVISTDTGCKITVSDVQSVQQYVFHKSMLSGGRVLVGDDVTLNIDADYRVGCMANHTATHLLSAALNTVLGNVQQLGSSITNNKLLFDFSCDKLTVSDADLLKVSQVMDQAISRSVPVYRDTLSLTDTAPIRNLRKLSSHAYPSTVHTISLGAPALKFVEPNEHEKEAYHSIELCGGTHVENLSHIGLVVITQFQGSAQGTKRIIAITRDSAHKAISNAQSLREKFKFLSGGAMSSNEKIELAKSLQSDISRMPLLPKVERERLHEDLEILINQSGISRAKNQVKSDRLKQRIEQLLIEAVDNQPITIQIDFTAARDVVSALASISPEVPVCVIGFPSGNDNLVGITYVPVNKESNTVESSMMTSDKWAEDICKKMNGSHSHPKGKLSKYTNMSIFSIPLEKTDKVLTVIKQANSGASR